MAYVGAYPISVASGGTEATNFSTNCLLVSGNGGVGQPVTNLSGGSTGQILIGNTAAVPSWTGSPSVSGSITAATGVTATTGNITATAGKVIVPATTSAAGQYVINTTAVFHSFNTSNLFISSELAAAGNFTLSGTSNYLIGSSAGSVLTSGNQNCGLGQQVLGAITSGSGNTVLGHQVGAAITTGRNNIGIGFGADTTNVLGQLLTGVNNIAIGTDDVHAAGYNYTGSESFNILLANSGVIGDAGVIRIGNSTDQTSCFIQGISGVTVANSAAVLINTTNGQLGTVASTIRLKENVKDMGQTKVMQLRPVTFNFKSDESKSNQYGLIAEEVYKIMPDIVLLDDKKQPMSVQYHLLPAILLNEIQKLTKRIELLEKK